MFVAPANVAVVALSWAVVVVVKIIPIIVNTGYYTMLTSIPPILAMIRFPTGLCFLPASALFAVRSEMLPRSSFSGDKDAYRHRIEGPQKMTGAPPINAQKEGDPVKGADAPKPDNPAAKST